MTHLKILKSPLKAGRLRILAKNRYEAEVVNIKGIHVASFIKIPDGYWLAFNPSITYPFPIDALKDLKIALEHLHEYFSEPLKYLKAHPDKE